MSSTYLQPNYGDTVIRVAPLRMKYCLRWIAVGRGIRLGLAGPRLWPHNETRSMPPPEAAPVQTVARDTSAPPLTSRQSEVAALVARGLTNREIAAQLLITERTAASHVEQILARLDLRSRVQVATWVLAQCGAYRLPAADPCGGAGG
jgi:DNA-binding CsgD family transcriptional regulator